MDGNVEEKETKKSEKKKPSKKNKFQPYELKSIVNHSGESAEYGHYFSDVYDRRTKTWLAYDDADINEIDEDVLLPSRAYTGYLFFYIHKSFLE
ncbi:ubiquitin carboxyl-terminal hydrolase 26-like [Xenopus laevis]|nr:ubiquitin carboxyl-terminal hydrolase 26-like [Xenopus laevis]